MSFKSLSRETLPCILTMGVGLVLAWHIYQPTIFQGPRSDQIILLRSMNRFDTKVDQFLASLKYQRAEMNSDAILFRPLTFAYLGLMHILFGNDFQCQQAASFFLHALVTVLLGVWILQWCGNGLLSGMLAVFFCVNAAGIEMVSWSHMGGYLLFSICVLSSVLCYARHLGASGGLARRGSLVACVAFAVTAALFHECGLLLIAFATATLGIRTRFSNGRSFDTQFYIFLFGLLFVLTVNLTDYVLRLGWQLPIAPLPVAKGCGVDVILTALSFWGTQSFLPSLMQFIPNLRTEIVMLEFAPGISYWVGGVCLALFLPSLLFWIQWKQTTGWRWCALFLSFTGIYSALIVYGRLIPRGLFQLNVNTYYAYIFLLFILIGIAPVLRSRGPALALIMLAIMTYQHAIAVHDTFHPLQAYYLEQSELLDKAETLVSLHRHEKDFTFSVSDRCPGQYFQQWPKPDGIDNIHWLAGVFPNAFRARHGKHTLQCGTTTAIKN